MPYGCESFTRVKGLYLYTKLISLQFDVFVSVKHAVILKCSRQLRLITTMLYGCESFFQELLLYTNLNSQQFNVVVSVKVIWSILIIYILEMLLQCAY